MVVSVNFVRISVTFLWIVSVLGLAGCGGGGGTSSDADSAPPPTLSTISVSPISTNLKIGENQQLSATGTYSDSSTDELTDKVTWSSSNTAIASVSATGLVTSIAAGSVTISATYDGAEGSTTGEMIDLVDLSISPSILTIAKDSTQQLIATGRYSDNSTEDLSRSVLWASTDSSVATIANTGLLTSLAAGTSEVNASLDGVSSTVTITISPAELKLIAINAPASIAAGMSEQLSATGTFSDGSTQDISDQITWITDDSSLAVIDESTGLFRSIQQGDVVVSAASNGLTATATITVSAASLTRVVVTPGNISIAKGSSSSVNVIAIFSDQSYRDVSDQVSWSSDNESIASVSSSNLIVTGEVGSALLRANLSGFDGTVQVDVTDAELMSLTILPVNESIPKGLTQTYSASGLYSDGSVQDLSAQVTWISDNESISTIDNNESNEGLARGIELGESTITAVLGGVSESTQLTVTDAQLNAIEIQPASQTIAKGLDSTVKAIGHYSDGTQLDITDIAQWSSANTDNTNILSLSNSQTGSIRALNEGSALINASIDNITGLGQVTVSAATLQSINIGIASNSVPKGSQQTLSATGTFSDGASRDISQQVTWQSTNTNIVTIDNIVSGLMSAVNTGEAVVSASQGGEESTISVTVTSATLSKIDIVMEQSSINVKTKTQATATATYSDTSTKDVTQQVNWATSNPNIASIENSLANKGLVNGVAVGTVSLDASLSGVSAESISLEITQDPDSPVAINLEVTPNVIINNSSDSAVLQATLIPASESGSIPDGTQVEFEILEGDNTRIETATTSSGVASAAVTSAYEGLIKITGRVTSNSANSSATLFSTDNFSNIVAATATSQVILEDDILLKDSVLAFFIRNLSNREFNIDKIWVTSGLVSEQNHLSGSPITDNQYLSDGTLSSGEFTALGYVLSNDVADSNINMVYFFTDIISGSAFVKGVTFNF